jgi:hypothetical protein
MRKPLHVFLFICGTLLATSASAQAATPLDNSALMPKILPDDQVQMEGMSPDWVKSLIIAEVRLETATPEGTFAAGTKVLDHYAEMGVNCLWIDPIWGRPLTTANRNGYGNYSLYTIYSPLTGTTDMDASFAQVKAFVDEAHRRNIRVLFDVVVWGTAKDAPLVKEHPEFYVHTADGQMREVWGGWAFDWDSEALKNWYRDAAVNFIEKTGADGFRVDLAPDTSGYFFKEVRDALAAKGRKIVIMAEIQNERKDTFDFEENGVEGWTELHDWAHPDHLKEQKKKFGKHNEFLFHNNIIDIIHTGRGVGEVAMQQAGNGGTLRFYTSNLLDHDDARPFVRGNLVRFGYASLFAPFIPMWWIGEEWNNPLKWMPGAGGVMYFNTIDWSALDVPANRAFYEDTKKYIRIRRSYPDIFEHFPNSTRDANIAPVEAKRDGVPNTLQAYGRFAAGRAILIVPNDSETDGAYTITPDRAALGLDANAVYKVTDLISGAALADELDAFTTSFTAPIPAGHLGIYLLEKK